MNLPTYPAARLVSDAVQGHFARHIAAARAREGGDLESPSPLAIAAIIDAAFWASLRREEGHAPRISMAFLPPEAAKHAVMFARRLPLQPAMLSKVAPAVERPGIHLGVWRNGDEFYVWGTTREVPAFCLVVEVVTSGLHRRQAPLRAVRQVRERRGARRRSDQDRRRAGRRGGPRLPRRGDLARGGQGSRQRIGIDDGARAAGGVDAAARARRGVVDRAV